MNDLPLADIVPYIDWSPFFMSWELKGKYPAILDDPVVGAEARDLFEKGSALLARLVRDHVLRAHGIYGFFPANSEGDDVVVYTDESRTTERCRFHFLRQQWERQGQTDFRSLADYVAPAGSGRADYLGAFAVTAGCGIESLVACVQGRSRRLQRDSGRGARGSPGGGLRRAAAPACQEELGLWTRREFEHPGTDCREVPWHPSRCGISRLPRPHGKANALELAGRRAIHRHPPHRELRDVPCCVDQRPLFRHPQARYFAVDMVTKDQIENYAARKSIPIAAAERWLAPNLAYEPA